MDVYKERKKELETQQKLVTETTTDIMSKTHEQFSYNRETKKYDLEAEIKYKENEEKKKTRDIIKESFEAANISTYRYSEARNITQDKEKYYQTIVNKTKDTDENIEPIREYARENNERSEKRRKHHMKKTHGYAKELHAISQEGRKDADRVYNHNNKSSVEYAKLLSKKVEKDLKICDARYKLEMHSIKIGGKKDQEENYQLITSKYKNLSQKIGILDRTIENIQVNNTPLDTAKYEKAKVALEKEMSALFNECTDEMIRDRMTNFRLINDIRRKKISKKNEMENIARGSQKLKEGAPEELEKIKDCLLKNADGDKDEYGWRKEICTVDYISRLLYKDADYIIELKQKGKLDDLMLNSISRICETRLMIKNTEVTFSEERNFVFDDLQGDYVNRNITPYLKKVRKSKSRNMYISETDRQNYEWNREYVKTYHNNDITKREELLKESLKEVFDQDISIDDFKDADKAMNDPNFFRIGKLILTLSNLKKDKTGGHSNIKDNKDIYINLMKSLNNKVFEIDGKKYDRSDFLTDYNMVITNEIRKKYKVGLGDGTVMPQALISDEDVNMKIEMARRYLELCQKDEKKK